MVGVLRVDNDEPVGAAELGDGSADALQRVLRFLVVVGQQVGDDLGVGLRLVGVGRELRFQGRAVLYDAVVDDHKAAVVGEVRVGVLARLGAVRRPAIVADARG